MLAILQKIDFLLPLPDNLVPILSTVEEAGHCPQMSFDISFANNKKERLRFFTNVTAPPINLPLLPSVRHFLQHRESLWLGLAVSSLAAVSTGPPPLPGRLKPVAG